MSSNPSAPAPVPDASHDRPRSRWRWFPLAALVALAIGWGVFGYLRQSERMAPAESGLAISSLCALVGISLLAWFVFFSAAPRNLRRATGWTAAALLLALVGLFRIDGVTGDVVPKLKFRWTPRIGNQLPTAARETDAATIDLATTTPTDSPEFMGPGRRGTFQGLRLARDWSAAPPKLLWRRPIGGGWSSFAIVGNHAVTQEQRDADELITCYEVDTGKLAWSAAVPVRYEHVVAGVGPRATPTIHEGKVYAAGATGFLTCLDGATGRPLWQHQIVEESGAELPVWGKSCSPLVYENLVIVSAGGKKGQSLLAYDLATGERVWAAGDDAASYSSPTVFTLCGVPQILMVNERWVTSHEPSTGKILWQHEWPKDSNAAPNVSQPLEVGNDQILLTKGYTIGSELWQIALKGATWSVESLWHNNNLKTKMTSAVTRDGFAYGLDEGILCCVEIATGARKWKKQKYGHGQVLLIDDLLLVQSETGDVALVEASPKAFKELTRIAAVNGQSWNYPALSGNRLLVRTEQEAACYELPIVPEVAAQ